MARLVGIWNLTDEVIVTLPEWTQLTEFSQSLSSLNIVFTRFSLVFSTMNCITDFYKAK